LLKRFFYIKYFNCLSPFFRGDLRQALTSGYIYVMLFAFPLFTGGSGYANITFSKYLFFVIATILWILALIIISLANRAVLKRPSAVQMAVLLFMLSAVLSFLFSAFKAQSFIGAGRYDGLLSLLLYTLIFLGVAEFGGAKMPHAYAFAASVSLCCIVGILQIFNLDILRLFPEGITYYDAHTLYTGEFLGTIGNVNILSSLLCLAIPLFFALPVISGARRDFVFFIPLFLAVLTLCVSRVSAGAVACALCAVFGTPLLMTTIPRLRRALCAASVSLFAVAASRFFDAGFSDGAFYAMLHFSKMAVLLCIAALCLLVLALLLCIKEFNPSRKNMQVFFSCFCFASLLGALVFVYFYPWSGGTLYELSEILHGNINEKFGSSRIEIWRESLKLFPERPLLGGGPDTLSLRLSMSFSRYVEETGQTLSTFVDNAHNEYLGYLINLGAFGFLSYLAVIFTSLFGWARAKGSSIGLALGFSVLCYAFQSFFSLGLCIVSPIFWLTLGLLSPNKILHILEDS